MKRPFLFFVCAGAILLAVLAAVYFPSFTTGYFHADDWFNALFYQNQGWQSYFTGEWGLGRRGEGGYYRPVARLYFHACFALFGFSAPPHHLFSFALHYVNVLLLWGLVFRLTSCRRAALPATAAASLFALFPSHPYAVSWLSGATELVHAVFYLSALNGAAALFVSTFGSRRRTAALSIGTLICVIGALLTKETAVGLPVLIIVLGWATARRGQPPGASVRRAEDRSSSAAFSLPSERRVMFLGAAALVVLTVYFVVRRWAVGGLDAHVQGLWQRRVIGPSWYSFLSAVVGLNGLWTMPAYSAGNLGAMAALVIGVAALARRVRTVIWAAAWLMLAIAPMSGIVVTVHNGGWLLYMPAAAWCVLLAEVCAFLIERSPKQTYGWLWKGMAWAFLAAVLVTYGLGSASIERLWTRSSSQTRLLVQSSLYLLERWTSGVHQSVVPGSTSLGERDVVVFSEPPRVSWPAPILDPSNGLHVALRVHRPDDQLNIRNQFQAAETTGTLVLLISPDYRPDLYRINSCVGRIWDAQGIAAQWQPGTAGRLLEASDGSTQLMFQVGSPDEGRLKSPLFTADRLAVFHLTLDYRTPVLTEGLLEWAAGRSDPRHAVHRVLLFNDPPSRRTARQIAVSNGGQPMLRVWISPVQQPAEVKWNSILVWKYELTSALR
ncbi:MAG: hypothetical protein Kow0059_06880 [Candidatus Sumerlaeia bacterium]